MATMSPSLVRRLRERNVEVEASDPDTLILKRVPTDSACFSKSHTNLLLIRPEDGLPFLVCVDEDLEYEGGDNTLARAFAGAAFQRGWRVLNLAPPASNDMQGTAEYVLEFLGFNRTGRSGTGQPQGRVLAVFGQDLTRACRAGKLGPTVGRSEEVHRVVAALLCWQARLPIVAGPSGAGKTNLLGAVARELVRLRPSAHVVAVHLGAMMAGIPADYGREQAFAALLQECGEAEEVVCAVENLDLAVAGSSRSHLLLCRALDQGLRVVGTVLPGALPHVCVGPLSRRLDVVRLEELPLSDSLEVLRALQAAILDHHGVTAGESILEAVLRRAAELSGRLPAKAIALFDAAAARASIAGDREMSLFHVYAAGAQMCEGGGEK